MVYLNYGSRCVVLKLDAFFLLSKSLLNMRCKWQWHCPPQPPRKTSRARRQMTNEMFTNDGVMSATQAESLQFKAAVTCTRKADESQINQTD